MDRPRVHDAVFASKNPFAFVVLFRVSNTKFGDSRPERKLFENIKRSNIRSVVFYDRIELPEMFVKYGNEQTTA